MFIIYVQGDIVLQLCIISHKDKVQIKQILLCEDESIIL